MIEDYHSPYKLSDKHISDMNPEKVKAPNLDSAGKFIRSTRIRVARNLKGYALTPGLTRNERIDIEKKVKNTVINLLYQDTPVLYYLATVKN